MAQDIRTAARRFYDEVFNRGNLAVVDELCAPTFVDHTAPPTFGSDVAGMKKQVTAWRTGFPDLNAHVEEMIGDSDTLAVRLNWQGTHKGDFMGARATGKHIQASGVDIIHFKDGRATEVWHYGDDERVLREIGVGMPTH